MQYNRERKLNGRASIALAVALALAAYLLASFLKSATNTPLSGAIRLNVPSNREIQVHGSNILFLEGSVLHSLDSSGNYIWNLSFELDSQFDVSDYGVAMWSNRQLLLAARDTGHSLFTKRLDEKVLSAKAGDRYVAAIIGEENDNTVVIMNHSGDIVDTLTDFKGYTVLDFGFFDGRELFWIMTLDSTGSVPNCRISTFIPAKRETGSITDNEQVIYEVMFRSSYIQAVGTNYIRLYDYTGSEQTKERCLVYGWYLEDVDKRTDNPLMLFVPNSQVEDEAQISDVRMIRGSSEFIIHLPVACRLLCANGNDFYGFSRDSVVKGTFGQKTSSLYKLPVTVDNVIGITDDNTAVVTSAGSIFLIQMP